MLNRLVLTLVVTLCFQAAEAKPPEAWEFKGWEEAVAQSTAERKPMFILFGYEDCQWCEYLYRRGMNDADLRSRFKQSFVLAYVDTKSHAPNEEFVMPGGARITHAELIKQFQAYPTPSWVFLSPTRTVLHGNRNGKSTSRDMQRDIGAALSKL
jgi:thioredoxin-related protein